MMLVAAGLGALSAVFGLYVSYYANIVSGAAIVLTATAFFLVAWLFNPRQGVLRRRSRGLV
jgi:ABC-type Mn2+/Zn2+ transport system permease subunit